MSSEEEKARARAYYYANKERCLERGRAWRAANKGKVKAYNAAYHAENRARENARSRAWKEENREGMNARRRERYAANITRERAHARNKKKNSYARNPWKYRDLARIARKNPAVRQRQTMLAQAWAERNRDRTKVTARRWYQRNLVHARIQLAMSQASRRQRRVPWANREAIAKFYTKAAQLTLATGRIHVVDHIIPLKGRTVSGLHVETNLRVIERFENARKSNKWDPLAGQQPLRDVSLTSIDEPPSQLDLFSKD